MKILQSVTIVLQLWFINISFAIFRCFLPNFAIEIKWLSSRYIKT